MSYSNIKDNMSAVPNILCFICYWLYWLARDQVFAPDFTAVVTTLSWIIVIVTRQKFWKSRCWEAHPSPKQRGQKRSAGCGAPSILISSPERAKRMVLGFIVKFQYKESKAKLIKQKQRGTVFVCAPLQPLCCSDRWESQHPDSYQSKLLMCHYNMSKVKWNDRYPLKCFHLVHLLNTNMAFYYFAVYHLFRDITVQPKKMQSLEPSIKV